MSKKLFQETVLLENRSKPMFRESFDSQGKRVLIPKIEAIHACTTKNHVTYTAEKLSGNADLHSGVYSWTNPYPKPVLTNHDTESQPLGRVVEARFTTDSVSGKSAITLYPTITDQEAIDKILDNRYLTVSIACEASEAYCSICGTNIAEEDCEHWRGLQYEVDGKMQTCEWVLGDMYFYEVSFVNVPADDQAMVTAANAPQPMEAVLWDGRDFMDIEDTTHYISKENLETKFNLVKESLSDHVVKFRRTESTITPPAPSQEPNNIPAPKGGNTNLNELEQLQGQLNQLQTELDALKATHEALQTEADQLKADKATLEATNTQLTAEKATLEADKTALESQLQDSQADAEAVRTASAATATAMHAQTVERILDLKQLVKTYTPEALEELRGQLLARSAESLKDTLNDTHVEIKEAKAAQGNGRVFNPALNNPGPEGDVKPQITLENMFHGLLTGKDPRVQ